MNKVSIVAHRGGAALRAENTLAAFAHVIGLGVDAVECDVHMMADGRVVVFHDFSLEQLTGEAGQIEAIDELQRQKLRIGGSDEAPPLLEELAALLAGQSTRLYLEIKTNGQPEHELRLAEASLAILRDFNLADRSHAISFEPECLAPFIAAGVPSGLCIDNPAALLEADLSQQFQQWQREGYLDLSLNGNRTPLEFITAAREAGFTTGVWTINGPARLTYWLAQPVHYITTDQPDLALRLRD